MAVDHTTWIVWYHFFPKAFFMKYGDEVLSVDKIKQWLELCWRKIIEEHNKKVEYQYPEGPIKGLI
ncbi:3510_t:CDS:2 [Rhizophagus irregularis]|uniref:Uncharacterized protein n=1 Tax=Rhizophagus irregularis (strain DAOM 181602 / DAOM 197198 / MUCL 43194) TaxID=747089 RepID=U9U107_RHIID|nr:3510_t:CDS:2 [Rhizophagus irregularis]